MRRARWRSWRVMCVASNRTSRGKEAGVPPQDLAQAALDPIAVMSLTEDLAGGDANARSLRRLACGGLQFMRSQEPAHRAGLLLSCD